MKELTFLSLVDSPIYACYHFENSSYEKGCIMDTVIIQYFLDIADGSTYEEVADIYHISQSSISKAITKLELELGVDLFVKKQHKATLTPAGKDFYTDMNRLKPQFHAAIQNMKKYSTDKKVSVCAAPSWDLFNMRYRFLMSDFKKLYPDIRIDIVEYKDIWNCTPDVTNDSLDFGIMHLFQPVQNNCIYKVLRQDMLWVLFPKNHPLSDRPYITPKDLLPYQMLASSDTIKHLVKELNRDLDFILEYKDPSGNYRIRRDQMMNRIAIDKNQCYTIFFESDIECLSLKDVCSVPLNGISQYPLTIAWKKGRDLPAHCQYFLDYFSDLISTPER